VVERANVQQDEEPPEETPSNRLTSFLLASLLKYFNAKDKIVRFRATQTVSHILNVVQSIDDDQFDLIRLGLLKRLRDKEPSVRVQAALGLRRLTGDEQDSEDEESDEEFAGSILEKLVNVMINDPVAEVRRAVLQHLPIWKDTMKVIMERARDSDTSIRRMVYAKIMPQLGDFRHMSLIHREKLIRWGLRDRDDLVRKATARLFCETWLEHCASTLDTRPEEERKPGEAVPFNLEALTELLERIDVLNNGSEEGIAHEAMREFWTLRPDYRDAVRFDHNFWRAEPQKAFDAQEVMDAQEFLDAQKALDAEEVVDTQGILDAQKVLDAQRVLNAENAFVARSLNDYCTNSDDNRIRDLIDEDERIPPAYVFSFVVEKHLNKLVELVEKEAATEEEGDAADKAQEETLEQDFVVQQLLHICLTLDYSDEIGRRQIFNLMRGALARSALPEECTKLAVDVLRSCCGTRGEADFCAVIYEAIAEVRDTLADEDEAEDGDDAEDSFHSAHSDVSSETGSTINDKTKRKTPKELDPAEEEWRRKRETMVYAKCLHIVQCTLQNVHCDLEKDTSLTAILNTLIIPAVRSQEAMIRERGVICLGLGALLSKVHPF
jgi:condensin complex subunit 3